MQEGISYLAGAELPCVIVDVMRGGPGLGNIAPEQSDYFRHGEGRRTRQLSQPGAGARRRCRKWSTSPCSPSNWPTATAIPRIVLTDGFVGQMMEPLDLEYREIVAPEKPWAVKGTAETRKNMVSSIFLESDDLEEHQRKLEAKYMSAQQTGDAAGKTTCTEDAELIAGRLRHRFARAALGSR